MNTTQARRALSAAEATAKADPTPATVSAYMRAQDALADAERAATRAATTPHVTKPGKPLPKVSGPRYFNLMRAIERAQALGTGEYAEYQPTTYCGAPRTEFDWDRRGALAAKNAATVQSEGVCGECLRTAANN